MYRSNKCTLWNTQNHCKYMIKKALLLTFSDNLRMIPDEFIFIFGNDTSPFKQIKLKL